AGTSPAPAEHRGAARTCVTRPRHVSRRRLPLRRRRTRTCYRESSGTAVTGANPGHVRPLTLPMVRLRARSAPRAPGAPCDAHSPVTSLRPWFGSGLAPLLGRLGRPAMLTHPSPHSAHGSAPGSLRSSGALGALRCSLTRHLTPYAARSP